MKNILLTCFLLATSIAADCQSSYPLSIEECYSLARKNYPLARQAALIQKGKAYSIENISKGYLPQVSFGGQASYQSDVTKIPIKLPNLYIENPSRDQYKVFGEVNQALFDGGIIKQQKQLQEMNTVVEEQKLEAELYNLKERINQLFFGILLIDEQLLQAQTLIQDIQSAYNRVEGVVNNGAALKSSLDVLKAELLKAGQREIELNGGRKAYLDMLGLFINQKLDENTTLARPAPNPVVTSINRPELQLFNAQNKITDVQGKLITARNLPKIGLFFQGGYGRPALNMLNNKFQLYYIGGLRMNWPLAGLYTAKNDRLSLELNKKAVDIQKETFLFNTQLSLTRLYADIKKLQELINADSAIIGLRSCIKTTAEAQLRYGTITSSDFIREVNAEDMAKQNLLVHEVQLIMTQYSYKVTAGN